MADPQTSTDADLQLMMARYGNKLIHQQSQFLQNTVEIPLLAEEDEEGEPGQVSRRPIKVDTENPGLDIVNVDLGTTAGIGTYEDGGARPAGAGRPAQQGKEAPILVGATVKFSLSETDLTRGQGDAVNKFVSTCKAHGSGFGAYMARSLIDGQVSEPVTDVAAGATSMTVPRMNGHIEGQTYDVVVDADGSLKGSYVARLVRGAFDGTAVVTFESALGFAIDVSADSIYLKGQGDSDLQFVSIAQIVDDTVDIHGLDENTEFPAGIEVDVSGAFSNSDGKQLVSMLGQTGDYPTAWLASPIGSDKMINAQEDQVRFIPGMGDSGRDPFADAMVPEFAGLPVVRCPQVDDTVIHCGNWSRFMLRQHVAYHSAKPAGEERGGMNRSDLFNSEALFARKLLMQGWYSSIVTKRRAIARFINVLS
jgi:hypothetical protein